MKIKARRVRLPRNKISLPKINTLNLKLPKINMSRYSFNLPRLKSENRNTIILAILIILFITSAIIYRTFREQDINIKFYSDPNALDEHGNLNSVDLIIKMRYPPKQEKIKEIFFIALDTAGYSNPNFGEEFIPNSLNTIEEISPGIWRIYLGGKPSQLIYEYHINKNTITAVRITN